MEELLALVNKFGYPILIAYGISNILILIVFVWFANKLFDSFKDF